MFHVFTFLSLGDFLARGNIEIKYKMQEVQSLIYMSLKGDNRQWEISSHVKFKMLVRNRWL